MGYSEAWFETAGWRPAILLEHAWPVWQRLREKCASEPEYWGVVLRAMDEAKREGGFALHGWCAWFFLQEDLPLEICRIALKAEVLWERRPPQTKP